MHSLKSVWNRRRFVQTAGSLAALTAAEPMKLAATSLNGVLIIVDPTDTIASVPSVAWAAKELERILTDQHVKVYRAIGVAQAHPRDFCVIVAGATSSIAIEMLRAAATNMPSSPESLGLVPGKIDSHKAVLACGSDVRCWSLPIVPIAALNAIGPCGLPISLCWRTIDSTNLISRWGSPTTIHSL